MSQQLSDLEDRKPLVQRDATPCNIGGDGLNETHASLNENHR